MTRMTPPRDTLKIFAVAADPESGEWYPDAHDTGRTTTSDEWCKKTDSDTVHYDTHLAYKLGDEVRLEYPGEFSIRDDGWVATTVAIECTWK